MIKKVLESEAQEKIIEVLKEIAAALQLKINLDADCIPGDIIASNALVTAISRIADRINAIVPHNCYIFHEKTGKFRRQLSIKEATAKLLKLGKNG